MILNLNENEQRVLVALYMCTLEVTSGEFGFMDEVNKCGLNKNQFAGYISSLKEKKVFDYLDTEGFKTNGKVVYGQYALTETAAEMARGLQM